MECNEKKMKIPGNRNLRNWYKQEVKKGKKVITAIQIQFQNV